MGQCLSPCCSSSTISSTEKTLASLENTNGIVPLWNLTPRVVHVISCIDGDTCVISTWERTLVSFHVRIYGLDTPEIHTKNLEEKKAGLVAKERLEMLIQNKYVFLFPKGKDKYGRILAEIYLPKRPLDLFMKLDTINENNYKNYFEVNVSREMVEKFNYHEYYGKKKESYF